MSTNRGQAFYPNLDISESVSLQRCKGNNAYEVSVNDKKYLTNAKTLFYDVCVLGTSFLNKRNEVHEMKLELEKMLYSNKKIDAVYEVDTACGGFATVVKRSDGTEELYPNCKVETVLDVLAAKCGKSLSRLRLMREQKSGKKHAHVDFYELDLQLILMPVRHRKAVNSNHGAMAYLNVSRVVSVAGAKTATITFISGETLQVKESADSVRGKLNSGKQLLLTTCFAYSEKLHHMRITLRRLQKLAGAGL